MDRINRQAELNGFDIGERYYDAKGDRRRLYEACEQVSLGDIPANMLYELMQRKPEELNDVEREWVEKITKAYDALGEKYSSGGLRAEINEKYGVDVDQSIGKERNRRSGAEQKAMEEYGEKLYAGVRAPKDEAREDSEAPADGGGGGFVGGYIDGKVAAGGGENDAYTRGYNRGYEAAADERRDIMLAAKANPDDAEAQAAADGVRKRIDDEAEYGDALIREGDKKIQHTDGSFHQVTLKETDGAGNTMVAYVVDGNVRMNPDGNGIDKAGSDRAVTIFIPSTGEKRIIDPTSETGIASVDFVMSQEDSDRIRKENTERSRQLALDEAEGRLNPVPGNEVTMPDGGKAQVVSVDNEEVTVRTANGEETTVAIDDLQAVADEMALADYKQRNGIKDTESQPEVKQLNLEQTLQGDGNGISLQSKQNSNGKKTSDRNNDGLSKDDGGRVAKDSTRKVPSYFDGRVVSVYGEEMAALRSEHLSGSERGRRRIASERLVELAKENGDYIPLSRTALIIGKRVPKPTGESTVYINEESGKVFKVKDPYSKSAMKGGVQPEDAVFEHLVHNILFPETRYTLEGISDDAGDVRLVLSQGYVKSAGRATRKQIEDALAERGLHKESEYTYGNDYVSVTDVDGDNVLVGEDGKIYFIDPIINFKKPINEVLAANAGLAVNGAAQNQTQNAPENFVIDGAPDEYTEGMRLTVRDEDTGEEKPAEVVGRVRYKGGKFVSDEKAIL